MCYNTSKINDVSSSLVFMKVIYHSARYKRKLHIKLLFVFLMATYKTPVFITKCAIFYTTMGLTSFMVKLQVIYDNIANIAWDIFIVTEIIVCWPLFQFYLCHLLSFKLLFACLWMQWNIFLALYVAQSIISYTCLLPICVSCSAALLCSVIGWYTIIVVVVLKRKFSLLYWTFISRLLVRGRGQKNLPSSYRIMVVTFIALKKYIWLFFLNLKTFVV